MELNLHSLNMDAWSDGQMRSKLWLCNKLESFWPQIMGHGTYKAAEEMGNIPAAHVWIYGAWYGTLAQFLLIRDRIKFRKIDLFDIDQDALEVSKKMTTMWWLNKRVEFEFHHQDCGLLDANYLELARPSLVINTSCEHFANYKWFENLPRGQNFLVQSTNMVHETHILRPDSLEDLKSRLGSIGEVYFEGVLPFRYPHFEFDRFMVIGRK